MSRTLALSETLKLQPSQTLDVKSIEASGDCVYDCLEYLLSQYYTNKSLLDTSTLSPLLRSCNNSQSTNTTDKVVIPTSQSMRDYVANQLTTEQLDMYKMLASAGLEEYSFATNINTLEELQSFAKKSGKQYGAGKCFWADEFALRTISDGLELSLLIVDDQATRSVGSSGRKRRRDDTDNRFVFIGSHSKAAIIHRTRREHYNALVVDSQPIIEQDKLPNIRSLWSSVGKTEETTQDSDSKPSSTTNTVTALASNSTSTGLIDNSTSIPMGNFYCGTAGFSSSSWVGNFYPKKIVGSDSDRQIEHFQHHFRTVEINSTFYGIPTESTVQKWKKAFATTFKLVLKAPKGVTHEKSELDLSVLSTFMKRMAPLKGCLSCILVQCPRTLSVTVSQIKQMKSMVDREASWFEGRIAFEFRNEGSFYNKEIRDVLRMSNFALVLHPNSLGRSTIGTTSSGRGIADLVEYELQPLSQFIVDAELSNFVYVRLHFDNDEHRGEYSVEQLTEISQQIHKWRVEGKEVYCFFLNDQAPTPQTPQKKSATIPKPWDKWCSMPKNARQLESLVYKLSNEALPVGPKKPKNTMLSFFGKR